MKTISNDQGYKLIELTREIRLLSSVIKSYELSGLSYTIHDLEHREMLAAEWIKFDLLLNSLGYYYKSEKEIINVDEC